MKSRLSSRLWAASVVLGLLTFTSAPARAQEAKQVVDEVIAQVNDDIITLSRLRSESQRRIEALKRTGLTEQQATDEVTKHRDKLINALIDDLLLVQKGKELGLSEKVEDEVNQRLHELSIDPGNPAKQKLYEEMRLTLRTEIMKRAVYEQEVDSPIFFSLSVEELHAYFDAHKDKFRRPESVTLSEIFLSSVGKDEAQVKLKVDQLLAQLHAGADFAKLAAANSEREEKGQRLAPTTGGKVGTFQLAMLRDDVAAAIKNLKVGTVSNPIRTNDGYQILRVDERSLAGNAPVFNQNRVREAMTIERSPKAHEEYLQRLRDAAFIELAKNYQSAAAPPR